MADIFEKNELKKMDIMFDGDALRDASSSIRGFIFQDLVALDYLVDGNTEFICTEYLEDLDVFCKDGTVKIMQVKYYPRTSPDREEIMTDLYYQYLRIELLKCKFNVIPMLAIHRNMPPKETTLEEMKSYVGTYQNISCIDEEEPEIWLKNNVYCKTKKTDQKHELFCAKAYDESIKKFLLEYRLVHITHGLSAYKMKVADKIDACISDKGDFDDDEIRKQVILGLAISYMQKRYEGLGEKKGLENYKCIRQEFIEFISEHMHTQSDESIIAYVVSVVCDCYSDIEHNNENLSEEQLKILDIIAKNTIRWLKGLVKDAMGQYRLLNTVSSCSDEKISQFISYGISARYRKITEHRTNIISFLSYLWKIMMDLNQELLGQDYDESLERLHPEFYINESIDKYICMKFDGDSAETSVILPAIEYGKQEERYEDIHSRMYKLKPRKWYMPGDKKGDFEYQYSIADTGDGKSILDVGRDSYTIECMKCIKVDRNEWQLLENCSECVFLENCIH